MISLSKNGRNLLTRRRCPISPFERPFASSSSARSRPPRTKRRRRLSPRRLLPPTKKDRLRSQSEARLPLVRSPMTVQQVTNRFEGRVLYVRQLLRDMWNKSPLLVATNTDQSLGRRPQRVGPTMDRRWWTWNIAFALLPATLIALYCELYAKHEMKEYYEKLEAMQKAKILGEGNHIMFDRGEGEEQPMVWLGEERSSHVSSQEPNSGAETSTMGVSEGEQDEDPIAALKRRIELLEFQLQASSGVVSQRREQQQRYQQQRVNQSNIQNRREDSLMEKWRKDRGQKDDVPEPTLTDKVLEAIRIGLMQNLEAKKDALVESLSSLKHTLLHSTGLITEQPSSEDASPSAPSVTNGNDVEKEVSKAALATTQAADMVRASVNSADTSKTSADAKQAAIAASEAAAAALRAAVAAGEMTDATPVHVPTENDRKSSWWRFFSPGKDESDSA